MPESPRWVYRNKELDGNHTRSAAIIASLAGVPVDSRYVQVELAEIKAKAQVSQFLLILLLVFEADWSR